MAILAPSLVSLRAQVNAIAPGRSKVSDGWIGDPAHASRVSDHNPDAGGIVRAIDLTDDPAGGLDALWLREALRRSRDPRIKYVISEGQMFSSYAGGGYPAWTWRPYNGPNGHFQHVHVSVLPTTAGAYPGAWSLSRDVAAPVRPPTSPGTPDPVEDDVTPEQLTAAVRTAVHGLLEEASTGDTPTGRQVRDYLTRILTPSVTRGVWSAEFGSGSGRQSAAERLALAAVPGNVTLPADVMDQLARQAAGLVDIEVTVKES